MATKYKPLRAILESPKQQRMLAAGEITISSVKQLKEKPKRWYMKCKEWILSNRAKNILLILLIIGLAVMGLEWYEVRKWYDAEKRERMKLEERVQFIEDYFLINKTSASSKDEARLQKEISDLLAESYRLQKALKNTTTAQSRLSADLHDHVFHTAAMFSVCQSNISLLAFKQHYQTRQLEELKQSIPNVTQNQEAKTDKVTTEPSTPALSGTEINKSYDVVIAKLENTMDQLMTRLDKLESQQKIALDNESATAREHTESQNVWFVVSGKAFLIVSATLFVVVLLNIIFCAVWFYKYCTQIPFS